MPAALPGSTASDNASGNPSAGRFVLFSPFSGPKGSPFDKDTAGNASTGALSTGIGFGSPPIIGPTAPASIKAAGFTDDYTPGVTMPDGTTASANSKLVAIGGGKSTANVAGNAPTVPYVAGFALVGAGNSGSRDATAGPAYQGFAVKTVTASGTVANGSAVETGFTNRSGASITTGQSVFGSSTTASGVIS
jgi:hypothetical protein